MRITHDAIGFDPPLEDPQPTPLFRQNLAGRLGCAYLCGNKGRHQIAETRYFTGILNGARKLCRFSRIWQAAMPNG
jgi:hypothetical protein